MTMSMAAAYPPGLAYQTGEKIWNRRGFFELNRRYFGDYAGKSLDDFNERIARIGDGMACSLYCGRPASILQVTRIGTGGLISRIPPTSSELTAGETYSNFDPDGDTLFLATYAVEKELRRQQPFGDGRFLTDIVLERALKFYMSMDARFVLTFSPAIRKAVGLHCRHGAKPVIRLHKARPDIVIDGEPAEDVIVMGYEWPVCDLSILEEFELK